MDWLIAELEATGLPFELKHGKKHVKLVLSGQLVGIVPRIGSEAKCRAALNVRAQIRRMSAKLKGACSELG